MHMKYREEADYRQAMDELCFSQVAKARMTRNLRQSLARQAEPGPARRTHWKPRIAAVAVAAALVLAVGAGATGGLKTVAQAFAGVFGPTADTQVMDQIGYPIGASDTDNGVTVTAEAILFDGYNYLMTYSIAREDGTAFSVEEIPQGEGRLNLTWDSADSTIGRNTTGAHGSSYFYDADPTDAAIQYVETMSYHEQAQAGGTVKITLQDLRTVGDRETASQVLAEGTWNLKFQLKAGDLSVRLPVGQTLEWNGMTATIDALVVSPIGYYLRYTVDQQAEPVASGTGQMTQAQEEQWARFDLPHGLKRTDGTVLSLSDGTGSTGGRMARRSAPGAEPSRKPSLWRRLPPLWWAASKSRCPEPRASGPGRGHRDNRENSGQDVPPARCFCHPPGRCLDSPGGRGCFP